jgi:hypothetical protein
LYRLLAGSALVAVIAVGCGGGGGHTTAPTTLPTVRITTTTTAPPPSSLQLQAALVQPTDLPTGWTAQAAAPPATQAADNTAFAQCVGAQDTGADVASTAVSPNYVSGTTTIASTATSFASAADVQTDTTTLINPKASACFAQVIKARLVATLPKTAVVKTVTLKITPGAGTGPANVVATGTGTIAYTVSGKTTTLNNSTVYLTGPRVEAHLDFQSTTTPVPAAVMAAVVTKAAARIASTP